MHTFYRSLETRNGYFYFGVSFAPTVPYQWGLGFTLSLGGLDLLVGPFMLETGWMSDSEVESYN